MKIISLMETTELRCEEQKKVPSDGILKDPSRQKSEKGQNIGSRISCS